MHNDTQLSDLMSRPDLPTIAETINATLDAERRARTAFRDNLTPSEKSEFIGGQVIVQSPAKAKHLRATERLVRLLSTFVEMRGLGEVFTEKALVGLTRNDYEPDICFFSSAKAAAFDGETMQFPAPDFVVEVLSDSTAARDRGVKYADYALHNVGEYWIIDCDEQTVEQYVLRDGDSEYHLARKISNGDLESTVVDGFRIPVIAIFDAERNRETLTKLLASE